MKRNYRITLGLVLSMLGVTSVGAQALHTSIKNGKTEAPRVVAQNASTPTKDHEYVITLEAIPQGDEQAWILSFERSKDNTEGVWVDYDNNGTIDEGEWFTEKTVFVSKLVPTTKLSVHGAIEMLGCANSHVSKIAFKGSQALRFLELSDNELEAIDLSGLEALETLSLSNNQLVKIDLSKNRNLQEALLSYNQLSEINVSMLPHLQKLAITRQLRL